MKTKLKNQLIVTTLVYVLFIVLSKWIPSMSGSYLVQSMLVLGLTIVLSILLIMYATKSLGYKIIYQMKRIKKPWTLLPLLLLGFWYACFIVLPGIVTGFAAWSEFGVSKMLADVLYAVSAGFWEETFLRGFLMGGFLVFFKKGKNNALKAVLLSSLIFGLVHVANIWLSGSSYMAVLQQVVYASVFGIGFGLLYLRTHSLLPGIIIHILIDLYGFMESPLGANAGESKMGWTDIAIVLLPMIVLAFVYLRPKMSDVNNELKEFLPLY